MAEASTYEALINVLHEEYGAPNLTQCDGTTHRLTWVDKQGDEMILTWDGSETGNGSLTLQLVAASSELGPCIRLRLK